MILTYADHYTEAAHQAVRLAADEARTLGHNYVGPEHIMLGLMREQDGVAAHVLDSLGMSSDDVRERIEQLVGVGAEKPAGDLPFTPRAEKILELAFREALALGHAHADTEHILLALVREEDGICARIRQDAHLDTTDVRVGVTRALTSRAA